jgi:hypothetical protein
MATTQLVVQDIVRTGLEAVYVAAVSGDGHAVDNAGRRTFLHVINGSGGDVDVTIATPNTADGLVIADRVVTVTAGEERMIGPFPSMYEQYDADNAIEQAFIVTYESTASVTVAALKLPRA